MLELVRIEASKIFIEKTQGNILDTAQKIRKRHESLAKQMTSIIGIASLLIDKEQTRAKKEILEIIKSSSWQLLKIINDMLDLAKIEAGKMFIEKTQSNILDTAQKIHKRYESLAKRKGIDFKLKINKNLPKFIIADITKIDQIITNLLDNAFKFANQGKIELYLGLKADTKLNENVLEFYVKDTGIGIAEEKIGRLFDRFIRDKEYITKKYDGVGLGLAIVKELTELMKGNISVESKLAKGTKFSIRIPVETVKGKKTKEKI
jgi:signal transduction histidine kinase